MLLNTAGSGTPIRHALRVAALVLLGVLPGCHKKNDSPTLIVPVVTTEPAAVTVPAGSPATFSVAAVGPPAPTYQWFRTDDAGHSWSALSGATGASYTLAAPTIDDNNAWFMAVASNDLGSVSSYSAALTVTAVAGQVAQIALPAALTPLGLAAGPDGNLWFTSTTPAQIGLIAPITHVATLVSLPVPGCVPTTLVPGPDGRMWFTEGAGGNLGAISLDGTSIHEYAALGQNPMGLTAGPDGALWYTLENPDAIGRMTTAGAPSSFPLATGSHAQAITLGSKDGNLWFTESGTGKLGRITPLGVITEWTLPTPAGGVQPIPMGLVCTPAGTLWIADQANAQLLTCTTPAQFTAVPLAAGAKPAGLTLDPLGNVWVADQALSQVYQVSPAGVVSPYVLPSGAGQAAQVAIASDGSLYATEPATGAISQVVTAATASGVGVTITSGTRQVAASLPLQFSAQVTGTPDSAPVWSIMEGAAGGSISATGLYTAPVTAGTYHVIATAFAAQTQTATAAVTVSALSAPVITVPIYVTANATGQMAAVPAQAGATYLWTLTGGTLTAGAGTHQITFTAGASGLVQLACTVTNASNTASLQEAAVSTIAPAPAITSFTAAPATVAPGGAASLTAVFSGGGVISPALGVVTSGVPVSTGALPATTTYTLTVANAAGTTVTATTQVLVN